MDYVGKLCDCMDSIPYPFSAMYFCCTLVISIFPHHRLGLLESQLSYGADRKISEHSNLGASITIGSLTGVMLKIR